MTAAELASLDLRGVAISAALEADGTLRPVGGIEAKALALLRGNSLPLPTVLVVAKDQDLSFLSDMRSGPTEEAKAVWTCQDGHGTFQVVRAANAADAVDQLAAIRGPWTQAIPDFSLWVNQHRGFVGREWLAARFHEFLAGDTASYWLLTAEPGWGKSAFLIHQLRQLDNEPAPAPGGRRWLPIRHFLKQGYGRWTDPTALLRSLIAQVRREAGLGWDESILKGDLRSLQSALQDTLQLAAQRLPPNLGLVLCIDGLDETFGPQGTDPRVALPGVLPERLPPGIKAVLTSRPGRHLSWLADARFCQTEALQSDTADNLADIRTYLHEARRAEHLRMLPLSDGFVDALERAAEGNFLAAVLYLGPRPGLAGELAEWQADFARIPKGLDGFLGDQWNRLLRSAAGVKLPERFVRTLLGLVALAREPLSWEQWQTVLNLAYRAPRLKRADVPTKREVRKLSQRGMELLDLAAGFFSVDGDNGGGRRFGFFHTRLAQFVEERLGAEWAGLHAVLGEACEAAWRTGPALVQDYALRWVPMHWLAGQEWDRLAGVLCDLGFVEARVRAKLIDVLLADYAAALAAFPERQEQAREALRRQEDVARWTREITAYAQAWSQIRAGEADPASAPPLPTPVAAVPWRSAAELEAERERIIRAPGRADRVEAFSNWVGVRNPALAEHGHREGFVLQEALNWARNGPVREVAEAALPHCDATLLLELFPPEWTPRPPCLRVLAGHGMPVTAVAVTPGYARVISGSEDDTIVRAWDPATAQSRELRGHGDTVRTVALAPDGTRAVSGSEDKTVRVWNLATGQRLELRGHTEGVTAVAITPDGNWVVSGSWDRTVRVWELATGQSRVLRAHTDRVQAIAITPDGRRAVSGGSDETVRVWDLATSQSRELRGHSEGVAGVGITSDGTRAVSGSWDHTVRVWDLATGLSRELRGHTDKVTAVVITPDGRRAVSGSDDGTLRVWDLATGQNRELPGHTDRVCAVAITPDGAWAASGSWDKTVRVWDLAMGRSRGAPEHRDRVRAVAITPDGTRALSCSDDGTACDWDLATGQNRDLRGHTSRITAVAMTQDSPQAVSGSDSGSVRVWDVAKGQSRELCGRTGWLTHVWDLAMGRSRQVRAHGDWVSAVAITPDGKWAVSASRDHSVRVWNLATGQSRELGAYAGWVTRVWDLATGRSREVRAHRDWVSAIAITPDGKWAVSGSFDGIVLVWNLATGHGRELRGHGNWVTAVAITPDGTRAVSGSFDGIVLVWDLTTGQSRELRGDGGSIYAVAISPRSMRTVSLWLDHTLRVQDLATARSRALFQFGAWVTSVATVPDGQRIVAGDAQGRVHLLLLHGPKGAAEVPGHGPGGTNEAGPSPW